MSPFAARPGGARTYELLRKLGAGGMAEVWEARVVEGEGEGESVALKRLRPGPALDPSARRAFLDEARIASQLTHDAIVPVLDWGVVEEAEHLVFRFVPGLDAGRVSRIRRADVAPFPEEVALFIVSTIADAVAHAHEARDEGGRPLEVVHRDVCPANVLLGWDGYVGLTDFGIARAIGRAERTASNVVKGKAGYIAPESFLDGVVDRSADVYGLGATLHALLAHHPPHRTWGAVARNAEPPLEPWIRQPVATLISMCMRREPRQRPTARDVAVAARQLAAPLAPAEGAAALRAELREVRSADRGQLDDLFSGIGGRTAPERVRLDDAARQLFR